MQQIILTNKTCWWNLLLWHNHAWGTLGFEHLNLVMERCNISSMRHYFIIRWNSEKRAENTVCTGVFLTNFKVFHLVMKHCVECLILLFKQNILEGEIKDAKLNSFSSDFQTLIKHSLHFLCIFFMNYWWVWEDYFFVSKECIMIIVVTKKFTKWTLK